MPGVTIHLERLLENDVRSHQDALYVDQCLTAVTTSLCKASRAIVMLGAGVSTAAGVPDFRSSSGKGLYNGAQLVADEDGRHPKATTKIGPSTFSGTMYNSHQDRTTHWKLVSDMHRTVNGIKGSHEGRGAVTRLHGLLGTMKRKGKLARCYTQNVDGFELVNTGLGEVTLPGLALDAPQSSKHVKGKSKWQGDVVQLHGSLNRVRCTMCSWTGEWDIEMNALFAAGKTIDCPECARRVEKRVRQSKRVTPPRSFVRPAIVLYNETNPAATTIGEIAYIDTNAKPDFLLVSGTTLKIPGFKQLVKQFASAVKAKGGLAVFVNKEEMPQAEWTRVFDYQIIGDAEVFAERIVHKWKRVKPKEWLTQPTLQQTLNSQVLKTAVHVVDKPVAETSSSPIRPPFRELQSSSMVLSVDRLPPLPPLAPVLGTFPLSRASHSFSVVVSKSDSYSCPSRVEVLPLTTVADETGSGLVDDQVKLPEYKQQAKLIFRRVTPQSEPRCSIESGACTLHYLIQDSIIYLTIADKSYPRKLAFAYLSELATEFARSYPPSTSLKPGLRPYAFVKFDTFIQRTKRLYLDPRGAEALANKSGGLSGLEQLNEDLKDVTQIMTKNMEDLLWRGDSLDRMSTMSSSLRDESLRYRKAARQINLDALYRKWAPIGVFALFIMVVVYWKFCEFLSTCLAGPWSDRL
ncbi:SNAP receptor [Microbotryomycetes sp. JL201]|nr:SNAP receptor [Microbotryomycetes sp. JL201]